MISVLFNTLNAAARTVVPGKGFQVIPNFGLNWSLSLTSGQSPLQEVSTGPKGKRHIFEEVDVSIHVNIDVLEICTLWSIIGSMGPGEEDQTLQSCQFAPSM